MRTRLLVDLTPLRASRQFRLLYIGQTISYLGTQMTAVAAPVQVYQLTGSSLAVGLLGLVQLPLLIVGSLLGGSLADTYDRRKVLLVAQLLLVATTVGLALNTVIGEPRLWAIYVLSGLAAGFSGIDHPTRSSSVPVLVERRSLPAALALNQLMWQLGLIVGPLVAGLLIAQVSLAATYWLDVATYAASIGALLAMRPIIPEGSDERDGRASILAGVHFLKGRQALQGTFVIDINAMVFGMPRALFPALAVQVFGGEDAIGPLYAAPAAGAFAGALFSGWLGRIDAQGRAVLWSVLAWGGAIAGFGVVAALPSAEVLLPLALAFLAVAGAADVVSAVFRNSILQLTVPDRLRGRLSAVHIAVVTGGPRLGDVEAGVVAALTSPVTSVITGGLACMAGVGVVAKLMPAMGAWRLSRHGVVDADVAAAD